MNHSSYTSSYNKGFLDFVKKAGFGNFATNTAARVADTMTSIPPKKGEMLKAIIDEAGVAIKSVADRRRAEDPTKGFVTGVGALGVGAPLSYMALKKVYESGNNSEYDGGAI